MPDRPTWYLPSGSSERWPEDYERGRPGWPVEVVDIPGLPSTATVLDLAAGTGKLTRLLTRAFSRGFAGSGRRLSISACSTTVLVARLMLAPGQSVHLIDD